MRSACAKTLGALTLAVVVTGCGTDFGPAAGPPRPVAEPSLASELAHLRGRLDYVHTRAGASELRSMGPDGSARPSRGTLSGLFPAPGPATLAVAASGTEPEQLVWVGASGARRLGSPAGRVRNAVLSPDGRFAIYESNRNSFRDLYRVDVATGTETRLTRDGDGAFAPAISRDGKHVAFVTTKAGHGDIHVMDADGGDRRTLTSSAAYDSDPTWSADGTQLAFSSNRHGPQRLFVMTAAGGPPRRVTTATAADRHEVEPVWSPDNRHIAFLVHGADASSELWVADWRHTKAWRVSRAKGRVRHPAWSPDGRYLWYSDGDRRRDVWAARVDGSARQRLTRGPGDSWLPRWRPARGAELATR